MQYTEIFKLQKMLRDAGIQFEFFESFFPIETGISLQHYQICYPHSGHGRFLSVIEGYGTYGADCDRLEIMLEGANDVTGWLTADEVFEIIKKT